jgi:hypothetical protein
VKRQLRDCRREARERINDRKHPELAAGRKLIMDEVHRPGRLSREGRAGNRIVTIRRTLENIVSTVSTVRIAGSIGTEVRFSTSCPDFASESGFNGITYSPAHVFRHSRR